jgi:hypothetical protein
VRLALAVSSTWNKQGIIGSFNVTTLMPSLGSTNRSPQAIETVRPTLAHFYETLSDEQKLRLAVTN